ncbi:MAG: recombinase family protein [Oscillospiraceae bacterium]|nr:recombinase family protein [Oscillospiraceae bacterium]
MNTAPPKVITIPAKPKTVQDRAVQRQLRVAAYCRVSTDEEEQLTSYEAQQTYYTDKIMGNPEWTMAGIFADEGITGTSARKRPEFLRMIRQCKQKKIDIVLTKSISRFARNTVDCLKYVRALRELGIAVIFEKENINTLETDSEMLITLLGAFAQAESESISANVRWGKRQAMREGRVTINYKRWYAYEKGPDGQPELDYERAQIVWDMGLRLLAGASLRQLKAWLEERQIPNIDGGYEWTISAIRSILSDVKNCGDILMQKTFTRDCISRKVVKNTGQLPMYLIKDHHEPIFDRDTFNAIQAELARRNARRSPSKKNASTGKGCYASKYALSERLVCGECGTLYRRCTWSRNGKKRVVWRCVSRLDYGTKYCHDSPTLDEEPLQKSILAAINSAMSDKGTLIRDITGAMELELAPIPGETMSIADIDRRLEEIKQEFGTAFQEASKAINGNAYLNTFKSLSDEMAALREKRTLMEQQQQENTETTRRIKQAVTAMEEAPAELADWNESEIRQLVDTVKVLSANQIEVYLRGGILITQDMIK